jgi:hypothetical protein
VKRVLAKPMKITIKIGEETLKPAAPALKEGDQPKQDEVTTRALSHPEVQRFKELFPDSQVRTVRNLRET